MMGPYLSNIATDDVARSPKEKVGPVGGGGGSGARQIIASLGIPFAPSPLPQLCQFFRTGQFRSALGADAELKPSLARRLLQRFQECFGGNEYSRNVDKCVLRKLRR